MAGRYVCAIIIVVSCSAPHAKIFFINAEKAYPYRKRFFFGTVTVPYIFAMRENNFYIGTVKVPKIFRKAAFFFPISLE